jgi:hypothetical protein
MEAKGPTAKEKEPRMRERREPRIREDWGALMKTGSCPGIHQVRQNAYQKFFFIA